jgi:hypothetical protein
MAAYTKRQIIDHVHWFLVSQLNRTGATYWTCVLRNGQLKLVAPRRVRTADIILADWDETPNGVPLRTVIHYGVNRNWDALRAAHIKIQEASLHVQ